MGGAAAALERGTGAGRGGALAPFRGVAGSILGGTAVARLLLPDPAGRRPPPDRPASDARDPRPPGRGRHARRGGALVGERDFAALGSDPRGPDGPRMCRDADHPAAATSSRSR